MKFKFDQIAINSTAKKKPEPKDAANYVGLEHLTPGTFEISEWGSSVAPVGEKLLMKKGDVLFGRRRAYQRKVGIAPFDGIFSAHGMVLRPRTEVVDENYFPFFISSDQFMNEAVRISVGSLSPTINWGTLKNCEFDLPPMEEQKKVAELLWAANDLKEKYKKAIIATDGMLKAKFREMFGRGDVSRGDAEERSKWPMVHLRDVCFGRASNGYFARQSEYNSDGNARIVCVTDVVNRTYVNIDELQRISISSNDLSRFSLKYGDMLFCRSSLVKEGIGKAAIIASSEINDCVFECHLIKISIDTNICHPVFMEHLSWAAEFRKQIMENSKTTTMTTISQDGILNVSIPLPPLSLQREFVAIAEKADAAKSALKKSIADIEQVMKGLINGQ